MPKLSTMQRLLRERVLGRYVSALEQGDLDTLASIMQRAEHDAVLEALIFELHATYQSEEEFLKLVQEEHKMDFKEGVHKSVQKDETSEIEQELTLASTPAPTHRKRARWLPTLAAILAVCVIAGGFLAAHIWHPGQTNVASLNKPPTPWCLAPTNMTPTGYLGHISGLADDDAWAIESHGPMYSGGIILHWDGTKWSVVLQSDGKQSFNNIVELASNNVWVVGASYTSLGNSTSGPSSNTLIDHWDGTRWQTVPSPNEPGNNMNGLVDISATSTNDIWAVGRFSTAGVLVTHWDGQSWSRIANPTEGNNNNTVSFVSVKALADNDVWIVGSLEEGFRPAVFEHWNGAQWQIVAQASELGGVGGEFISNIDGTSANDLWAVGNTGNGVLIEHWDGQKWHLDTPISFAPDNADNLASIAAAGPDDAWAVGQLGTPDQGFQPIIEHWNGHQWQVAAGPMLSGGLEGMALIGTQPWAIGFLGKADSNPSKPLLEMPCK